MDEEHISAASVVGELVEERVRDRAGGRTFVGFEAWVRIYIG